MTATVAVVTFPGSNGDHDAYYAMSNDLGLPTRMIDYRESLPGDVAAIILPGGFSYGDHLRSGAIARFAPVMDDVRQFALKGGPVLGICNGFQILTEAHLLPGALLRNRTLRFHCHWTHVRVEQTCTAWTTALAQGEVLRLPVAHGDGSYFADEQTVDKLEQSGRVVLRYCQPDGSLGDDANPNGSVSAIAGVVNEGGNVVGMMPHPERATDALVGGGDGRRMLESVFALMQVAV